MSELKTLKDLPTNHDDKELKAEAVKWIKETKKYKGEFSFDFAQEWIKHFFDLTEEDLR